MNVKAKQNLCDCVVSRVLDVPGSYQYFLSAGADSMENRESCFVNLGGWGSL